MSDVKDSGELSFPSNGKNNNQSAVNSNNSLSVKNSDGSVANTRPGSQSSKISISDDLKAEIKPASTDAFGIEESSINNLASEGNTIAVNSIKADFNKANGDKGESSNPKSNKKTPSRKKVIARRVILGIVGALLGLLVGVIIFLSWYKHYLYTRMEIIPTEENVTIVDESGNTVLIADLTEETEFEIIDADHVHNFLLIGVDSRGSGRQNLGNSDVNMVMSVDDNAGTIKMISIARDTYAYVPGYSNPMKINAAMAYGGPELLKATIENMLRISIDGYAFVNFYNMAGVIDAVGGVYVYATQSEVYSEHGLNWNLAEINNLQGLDPGFQAVSDTGNIWLNGRQAVAYARIRYIGNGDYERSERQVEVLRSLLSQFSNMSVTGKAAAIDDILSLIATNISEEEVTNYAFNFLPSLTNVEIQYLQLPIQGCFNSGMYGSEWSIRANWNAMIPYVQEFFYGEQTEFDPVRQIPSSPELNNCTLVEDVNLEELIH